MSIWNRALNNESWSINSASANTFFVLTSLSSEMQPFLIGNTRWRSQSSFPVVSQNIRNHTYYSYKITSPRFWYHVKSKKSICIELKLYSTHRFFFNDKYSARKYMIYLITAMKRDLNFQRKAETWIVHIDNCYK